MRVKTTRREENSLKNILHDTPLEMWAGIECTVNRVGDAYGDQMRWNGHEQRIEDLERFAALGVRALRYPVLWEKTAPESLENIDWTWPETRLNRLRELGVRPIVGLTHHGSGPRHTSLTALSFAEGLSAYAGKVAERFPWVQDWTPVNEPLTTARFSGLYGHWYPHGKDEATFACALINQCRGVVLAMAAIRRVTPSARLIQTDDLGHVYATPRMTCQAEFENERRWVTWDLLCGRVNASHRMWGHFLSVGIAESELEWFLTNPCPPDMLGVNHYLTSDRYLDENCAAYPPHTIGDNGRERYADVEAVRVLPEGAAAGIGGVLREAWNRYEIPLAVTEAHLGCTREEQIRWLWDVWQTVEALRREGVDARAVTAWALLGSYDWNSLLTRFEGHYEPGVFDARSEPPRSTALTRLIKELSAGQKPTHPALASPGWWQRPKRALYAASVQADCFPAKNTFSFAEPARPLLIIGSDSVTGSAFARLCDHRGLERRELPAHHAAVTRLDALQATLEREKPWAVIYAADSRESERTEKHPALSRERGALVPEWLAARCREQEIRFLLPSSYQVFSGADAAPYRENDSVGPRDAYGRGKAEAETRVAAAHPEALIARSGPLFGPWDAATFLTRTLTNLAEGQQVFALDDETVSPTYLPDFVHACLDLLVDGEAGLWHLANPGAVTWTEFAERAAERAGLTAELAACSQHHRRDAERTPTRRVLASERGTLLPPLESAIEYYLRDCGIDWRRLRDAAIRTRQNRRLVSSR